jgi:predicted  nucleic acid-binding Zn-ribbon protein
MNITPEHLDWIVKIGGLLSLFGGLVTVWVTQKNKTAEIEKDLSSLTEDHSNSKKVISALNSSVSELYASSVRHENDIQGINTVHLALTERLASMDIKLAQIMKDIEYLKK